MRLLKRNLRTIKYALYQSKTNIVENTQDAWETGEKALAYSQPVELECNVSSAMGRTAIEMFGDLRNYEKIIVTDDTNCPINEQSILFVDVPGEAVDGKYVYDYIVRRVAKSLNCIAYAVSHVDVSQLTIPAVPAPTPNEPEEPSEQEDDVNEQSHQTGTND